MEIDRGIPISVPRQYNRLPEKKGDIIIEAKFTSISQLGLFSDCINGGKKFSISEIVQALSDLDSLHANEKIDTATRDEYYKFFTSLTVKAVD